MHPNVYVNLHLLYLMSSVTFSAIILLILLPFPLHEAWCEVVLQLLCPLFQDVERGITVRYRKLEEETTRDVQVCGIVDQAEQYFQRMLFHP